MKACIATASSRREGPEQATLFDLVDQRRRQLPSSAFALGHRLHAEKPSSFAKRLVAYRAAPHP